MLGDVDFDVGLGVDFEVGLEGTTDTPPGAPPTVDSRDADPSPRFKEPDPDDLA
jgi:hypothetical protein